MSFGNESSRYLGNKINLLVSLNWLRTAINSMGTPDHSGWTPFHPMYENSTLCTKWFVHKANAAGAFIVHQGNIVEHFGSYIKWNGVHSRCWCAYVINHFPCESINIFMMSSLNGNIFHVTVPFTSEFLSQRPVTQGFDVCFDLCPSKRLSKQSRRRWFGTPSRSLWRHCDVKYLPMTPSPFLTTHLTYWHSAPNVLCVCKVN